MHLSELLTESERAALGPAVGGVEIRGLTADSREVAPGFLFAALPGTRADGRAFIAEARGRGAAAVLAPAGSELKEAERLPLILADNPRQRLARMAAAFYGPQPRRIAAVTGTNGKTSVVTFTRSLWQALGRKAASLGTLGLEPARAKAPAALTTPDPVELARCLAELAAEGVELIALEASSHGLDQYRLDGLGITSAAFTNLSRDHLDYHRDMESYWAAKRRLFAELLQDGGAAVVNADAPQAAELARLASRRGLRLLTYGRQGKDLKLLGLDPLPAGLALDIEVKGRRHALEVRVAGTFQAMNLLAALGLVLAEGAEPEAAVRALAGLRGVPGRVEPVGETPSGGQVFVDYAHTPDALETLLRAMRPHTAGRLLVVFGCGGDRDPGKRPLMGEIAGRLAEVVYVTDDNPRSEAPAAIRAAILAAVKNAFEFGDRGAAIAAAIAELGPGDTLVIAGKGHETGQIVAGKVLPFDDRVVARAAISRLREGAA